MKIVKIAFILLLVQSSTLIGQVAEENWDLMLIREDKVYPSLTRDYEIGLTDLKTFLSNNKIKGFNYFTHLHDNYTYSHVTPIKELKDLDNGIYSYFSKNIKNKEFEDVLFYLDNTVESFKHYLIKYQPEISYVPKDENWTESMSYRKWHYFYFYPGIEILVDEILAAYKQLYSDKNIQMGFRVFTGFLGVEEPLYILTTWANTPLEFQQNLKTASGLLGEEGEYLWNSLMEYVRKTNTVEGYYLPQYSFTSGMKLAD